MTVEKIRAGNQKNAPAFDRQSKAQDELIAVIRKLEADSKEVAR